MAGKLGEPEPEKSMKPFISSIWRQPPSDLGTRIEKCVRAADADFKSTESGLIYFRADDVGVPGRPFDRMLALFSNYRVPLSLAVVPAWLTHRRWNAIQSKARRSSPLWCWHQHGWRHVNHETGGKHQEFGSARQSSAIKNDLLKGRQRLENILGNQFYPVFTPPWNRCNLNTLELLEQCGYLAVSRDCGALPSSSAALPDYCMHIDLHTQKTPDPVAGWDRLFKALKKDISAGRCGIMLHHQKMNEVAFDFLEILLKALKKCKKMRLVNFKDVI
jgi:peptidoglycan/xylan/chitin deacetylase (PgdA/CDA1 family)